MTVETREPSTTEAFATRVVGIGNSAYLAMLLALGHETGLFDSMATLPPATSEAIAAAAGLQERYVREWLAALACGRVVAYDPVARTFHLPPEHAAVLTRAAGPGNLARFMAGPMVLAPGFAPLATCFREGGGVPAATYAGFVRLMSEVSGEVFDARLLDTIVPLVPGLADRLAGGSEVVDIGCGAGHALTLLAAAFPRSRFTGYDIDAKALAIGRAEAESRGLGNVRFVEQNAATLNLEAACDVITAFDAIHDQTQPTAVLTAIHRALRQGGVFLMVDPAASSELADNLDHPIGVAGYAVSLFYCMSVSLAAGGVGLGSMWGDTLARKMLVEAGFSNVEVHQVEGDIMNAYYVCPK